MSPLSRGGGKPRPTPPPSPPPPAPPPGRRLYQHFAAALAAHGVPVSTGVFGADMAVALVNDGPVTIWLDSEA